MENEEEEETVIERRKLNLKITASTNVKAGVRLLKAEASVGELNSIPLYPHKSVATLSKSQFNTQKKIGSFN